MIRNVFTIAALSIGIVGLAPDAPLASTPPPALSISGFEVTAIERAFVSTYNNAYRDVGALGLSFVPVLYAYRSDFGFEVNPEGFTADMPEKDRLFSGIRLEHPSGLKHLPKETGRAARLSSPKQLSPFFGVFANAIAASCTSAEQGENEKIVAKAVAAKAPPQMHHRLLEWTTQLHGTLCIGTVSYASASKTLIQRTQAAAGKLEPADRIFSLYALYRAGVKNPATAADLEMLLRQDPVETEWEGARSHVFGRRDAVLAASYVLLRVLAENHAGTTQEGAAAAVARLYEKNLVLENTPLAGATMRLKPQPPAPDAWDPDVLRYFKRLTQVKVLADSDPRRLGPVSCGCVDDSTEVH